MIPPAGPHGDDAGRVAAGLGIPIEEVLDLATSLNPVAPDVRLIVAASLDDVRRYPDATEATAALAQVLGASRHEILLTNGGAEAIALLAAELGVGSVDEPEFSLYRRHLDAVVPDAPKWRSNPNNPSGLLASSAAEAFVWDEAFYQLATGDWTRGDAEAGSIVVGSLTKLFACPGLRMGYVFSRDEDLIARLANRQPRWAFSSLACATLPRLLDIADLTAWATQVASLREELARVLGEAGYGAEPSDANFVLVRQAAGLRARLAPRGIVVRDCTSFGMPDAVRIAVPSAAGIERLTAALAGAGAKNGKAAATMAAVAPRLHGALLVCGTASDAGKSHVVTGLCRLLARRGVKVAPFKAQNMSLNSFATASGHEIGRAQGIQAIAAGVVPEVAMNPVLLKPTGERRSQVVVMGSPVAELDAVTYQATKRSTLGPVVLGALADLRSRFEVVICEGAGSPAEINLLDGDIANLSLARDAGIPAILVGDIERGGVFAALYGTMALLPDDLASNLKSFIVNKFRGDVDLLRPGLEEIESRTHMKCLGVLPYLHGLSLDSEDSLGLAGVIRPATAGALDIAVVALPHLANFTDLDALAIEPGVALRLVASPGELGDPDLVIIGGSKTTVTDLEWLKATHLAECITALTLVPDGAAILGICAGYQMLGTAIIDGVESRTAQVTGMGVLPVVTTFDNVKLTRPRRGSALGESVAGYEIRQGQPLVVGAEGIGPVEAFAELDDEFGREEEGVTIGDGRITGSSLHGLFESDAFRRAYLGQVAKRRHKVFEAGDLSFAGARESQIERLADLIEDHLDTDALLALIASAGPPPGDAG
jgi:adenosylcobyric acid synthase